MANQPKKYKKFVATAATATLVASAIVPVAASAATPKFPDIAGTSYEAAINAIADLGVVSGYTDGTFKPYNTVDRAGVVKFLGKFLVAQGETLPTYEAATANGFPFSDLTASSDKELVQYAALVKAEGVFTGYTDGTLNPTQEMPRHQMASVLVKAIKAIYGIDLIAEAKAANFVSDITDIKGNVYEEAIAALDFAGLTVATQYDPSRTLNRGQFANFLSRSIDFVAEFEANKEAKVSSVKAIDGKTLEIKFTKAVKESSVISTVSSVDYLNASNFTLTTLDGKTITLGSTTGAATAELSEDGKTLTVTAGGSQVFQGRYQVVIDNVQDLTSVELPKFDQVIDLGKDTVAPSITSTTKVNANTTKVVFSESVTLPTNSVTYKLADGTVVPTADITVTPTLSATGKEFTFTVAAGKYVGKTITATLIGAQDAAGNLLAPNPSTFSIQVGDKDGVAPTVTSVTAASDTEFVVNFAEEVQGFTAANFSLTGTDINASLGTPTVKQDTTDKKKWTVTYPSSVLASGKTSTVADVAVSVTGVKDLSGEDMTAAYSQIVSIKKDTVAPKLVSSSVITEAGEKYLVLNFDEAVTAPTAVSAKSVKDYVTTDNGTFTVNTSQLSTDKKTFKIALDSDTTNSITAAQFNSSALVAGATYTVDFNVTDITGNTTTSPVSASFTYTDAASSDKPEVNNATTLAGQSTVVVTFDREVDGATATNAANYSIAGVKVKSATLAAVSGGTQSVTLTLDSNDLSGSRAITISNVKSKAGVAMDTFNGIVALTENVKPEVKSAKVTSTSTIEVTFSEVIEAAGIAGTDDFVIKAGSTTLAYGTTANTLSADGTKVVVTLDAPLSATALAETITLETLAPTTAGTSAIEDVAGNVVKTNTVTVSK